MYVFEGDPNISQRYRNRRQNRGGSGIVELREDDKMLVAHRDIILGLNVPGYE